MAAVKACDRCQKPGGPGANFYYNVTPGSPFHRFRRGAESFICATCLEADPAFRDVHVHQGDK